MTKSSEVAHVGGAVPAPSRGGLLLLAAVLVWLGLVMLAPFADSRDWLLGPLLYDAFHRVCHQIPERSFFLFGHPLAVCHRCFGLYSGFLFGLLLLPGLRPMRRWLLERPRWVFLFLLPLLIDVAWSDNTAATRFATGLLAAFPVALFARLAVDDIFHRFSAAPRRGEHEPGNA